jgi:tetratricopeptide (TPR) repeat protein
VISALETLKTAGVPALVVALACFLPAQVYKLGPSSEKPQSPADQTPAPKKSLGWGSNIENARLARAAELALKDGNHAAAVAYAERAAQSAPSDPQLWFLLGYAERLDGKLQLAVDAYSRGLRLKPSSLDGISGLAQTYSVMGKTDEAKRLLNQVLSADPKRITDAVMLGEILLRSGQYDDALDVLERAEKNQQNARSELLMALAYEHEKKLDLANRYLGLAKHNAPDSPDVQRSLAGYYRETGNYRAAIAALESIRNPRLDVKAELAYTYQLDGKGDESAKLYVQAANAAPGDLALQLSAAQAEVSIGAIEPAKHFLERAATLDADNYRLHAVRGEIARLQERDEEAAHEYQAALAHLPQSPPEGPLYGIRLNVNLAELYRSLRDTTSAENQLKAAQAEISALDERGPDRPQFLRLRALIKMTSGDLDGAGSDLKEALARNAKDPNGLQLEGDLLVKLGRTDEAIAVYKSILTLDPMSRSTLTSLGYVYREAGHDPEAEKYFQQLAAAYPTLYTPYLALGDMYTARRDFARAEAAYSKGYELAPKNSLIVAGGMNAAIETKRLPKAAEWLSRATSEMQQEPHLLREKERYLSFKGDYKQSAEVGRQAIKELPRDRDVVVYLGYDLLNLEKYNELLQLTSQYEQLLPKEPDIPLLAGYVHKHQGLMAEAEKDFTETLTRDPSVVTAYVNRGYVLHDLHQPKAATADFEEALKREPNNGEAHLGLAYASLDMHQSRIALREVQLAEAEMGESLPVHLIRATAYGQNGMWTKAATEYRIALKYSPNDGALHLALADTLYGQREYHQALDELQIAQKLSPDSASIYAQLARVSAQLKDREQTLRYVQLAEEHAQPKQQESIVLDQTQEQTKLSQTVQDQQESAVLVSTGQALSLLGDQKAAMERFERALAVPESDRISVRLAIAELMASRGELSDAQRQIALALMEAQSGETLPATGQELLQAASLFLSMHDYQLAQTYLRRALATGASDTAVRIGMANTYLALGETVRAKDQLSLISNSAESDSDYQLLLAKANVYRQEHQNVQALTAFAQAANAAGEDQTAAQDLLQAGANEGLRIDRRVSFLSTFSVEPIFENTTVYPLDAKLDAINLSSANTGLLPPPRSSIQTQWTGAYHLHLSSLPDASGFFQVRNARGEISVPATASIVNRDTTDYSFNFGLNPTFHLGSNVFTFNAGIQETIRRDSLSPVQMNQNLFRQFVYMSTSSFFNMVSLSGYAVRETGPFTLSKLHSRALTGAVDFRVGRPWGNTALVTGWGALNQYFYPVIAEDYHTSSYIGFEHRVSEKFSFRAVAEDLRAYRVAFNRYAIAQALRPAGRVEFAPTRRWSVQASAAYSRNMGFHAYDAIQTGFAVSYQMPVHRQFNAEGEKVELRYPIRCSAGMQQETFFNFSGGQNQQFRPYISISIF